MLLRTAVLERIVRGEISLVFRRWRRPTVRTGGSLRTALGVLRILEVAKMEESDVSDADAAAAGYASRAALLEDLGSRAGQLYRIAVEHVGADPRIALRRQDELSGSGRRRAPAPAGTPRRESTSPSVDAARASRDRANPAVAAQVLARRLGYERHWLKPQVRKLKNLGLTVSLPVGYELSPRGRIALRHLRADESTRRGDP